MLEISAVVDAASLFAGVIGLLFANWVSDIQSVAGTPIPRHYADRRKAFDAIVSAFFYKALPLLAILLAYSYANLGVAISILTRSKLYNVFRDGDHVQSEWSVFMLVYAAMIYFTVVTGVATIRLIAAWKQARKGRTPPEPRIHIFG